MTSAADRAAGGRVTPEEGGVAQLQRDPLHWQPQRPAATWEGCPVHPGAFRLHRLPQRLGGHLGEDRISKGARCRGDVGVVHDAERDRVHPEGVRQLVHRALEGEGARSLAGGPHGGGDGEPDEVLAQASRSRLDEGAAHADLIGREKAGKETLGV